MARVRSEGVARRFGDNLRRVRRREGFTQEELALRASLHCTEIGKLERGERVPRIDTLVRLTDSMCVPVDELLEGINWVPVSCPGPVGEFAVDA